MKMIDRLSLTVAADRLTVRFAMSDHAGSVQIGPAIAAPCHFVWRSARVTP